MGALKYVSDLDIARAQKMEKKFQILPAEAGVLFVSIYPIPIEGGRCLQYFVRLGIRKSLDERTGLALIRKVLEVELALKEVEICVSVYRGVAGAGASSDQDTQRPDSTS